MTDTDDATVDHDHTGSDPDHTDVDPDALREDLDAIKDAMGLEERYPGQARMWLVYGAAIGLTAVLTNAAFYFPLPNWAYVAGWFAMVGVVVVAQWRLVSRTSGPAAPTVDWRQLFAAMGLGYLALTSAESDLIATNTGGAVQGIHFFSQVLVLLGLAFLVVGIVLGAEGIERRDRLPFYVGGAWMLGLAGIMPHVRFLQLAGWGVFGLLFLAHSVGAYLLTRS